MQESCQTTKRDNPGLANPRAGAVNGQPMTQPPDLLSRLGAASPATPPPAALSGLEVVSIAKSYDKRVVLSDISLSVAKGEVLGLLGPNGAGKTTCFYSIMGLVRPDAGRILLDGIDITSLPMYRRAILGLGYLPQETSIFREIGRAHV